MADEFNLVPTNNLEKHLDNILRAASGEEPQYNLSPNWRVEQYLAAIASALASGGGGGGGVLIVKGVWNENSCVLEKTWEEIKNAPIAIVEVTSSPGGSAISVDRMIVSNVYTDGNSTYSVSAIHTANGVATADFITGSPDGYPTYYD